MCWYTIHPKYAAVRAAVPPARWPQRFRAPRVRAALLPLPLLVAGRHAARLPSAQSALTHATRAHHVFLPTSYRQGVAAQGAAGPAGQHAVSSRRCCARPGCTRRQARLSLPLPYL
jgi:hypothetical protein